MDIGQMMKKAQDLQAKVKKAQEALESEEVTGTSGGGLVEVTINGKGIAKKVIIKAEIFQEDDRTMVEDLIVAAFNNAKDKLDTLTAQRMGELGIPTDMFKM